MSRSTPGGPVGGKNPGFYSGLAFLARAGHVGSFRQLTLTSHLWAAEDSSEVQ